MGTEQYAYIDAVGSGNLAMVDALPDSQRYSAFCYAIAADSKIASHMLKNTQIIEILKSSQKCNALRTAISNAIISDKLKIVCEIAAIVWPRKHHTEMPHRTVNNSLLNKTLETKQLYYYWHYQKLIGAFAGKAKLSDYTIKNIFSYLEDELEEQPISGKKLLSLMGL